MEEITLNNGGSNPGVKGFKGNTLQQLPVVDHKESDMTERLHFQTGNK